MTRLLDTVRRLLGFTQLELELELARSDFEAAEDLNLRYMSRIEELEMQLDRAHFTHLQDQTKMAEVAQQRWAAVAALTGGIEMLQHSWHDRSAGLQPRSDKYQLYRRCSNELGGLKNSIQRNFGIHPSQAPKTTDHLLPNRLGGELTQE